MPISVRSGDHQSWIFQDWWSPDPTWGSCRRWQLIL